jgi:predicted glycoside hydrolase/deacetylase ChbG (UPF0249 family)
MYSDPIEKKLEKLLKVTQDLTSENINLFVTHILEDTPEVQALVDLNPFGPKDMSKHRAAELSALLSPEFSALLEKKNISLITYKDLIDRIGLENMKSPIDTGY